MAMRNATGAVMGAITTASIDSRMKRDDQQNAALSIARHIEGVQSRLDIL
jgi:hypothetical protein